MKHKKWTTGYRRGAALLLAFCCMAWMLPLEQDAVSAGAASSFSGVEGTVLEETWQNNDGLLVPSEEVADFLESASSTDTDEIGVRQSQSTADALPDSYSLLDVEGKSCITSVKDQGSTGLCWAYASLGACESNVLLQGLDISESWLDDNGELNFSEAALGYYPYTDHMVLGDFTSGDSVWMANKGVSGGNVGIASYALAAGVGPQLEQYATMDDWDAGHSEYQRYNAYYQMESSDILWYAQDGYEDTVKSWLMESGAVAASFYSKGTFYENDTSYAYYQTKYDEEKADHAILIVGWDDNYSKSNFQSGSQPDEDGAWLVRNSWGDDDAYGGYFWMSYEEPSLCEFAAFHMTDEQDNTTLYQYDGGVSYASVLFYSAANVFTAEADGVLDAVMFPMTVHNNQKTYYTISVYALSADAETPTDGTKLCTKTGAVTYAGYKNVSLGDMAVSLEEGQQFSIVLQLRQDARGTELAYLAMESNHEDTESISRRSMILSGQSYLGSSSGDWIDVVELQEYETKDGAKPYSILGNVAIKAVVDESANGTNRTQLEAALAYGAPSATANSLYQTAYAAAVALSETATQREINNAAANLLAGLEKEGSLTFPKLYYAGISCTKGDVNQDGIVDATDAYLTLDAYVKYAVNSISHLRKSQVAAADLDEDGNLTPQDAYYILKYYAEESVGGEASWSGIVT